jgi:hypothetical protein
MPVKYLYLDDESPDKLRGYIHAVKKQADAELEIERVPPRRYDKQVEAIRSLSGSVYGVILDFRLDMRSNEIDGKKEKASYRAASIAQEIRSLGTEGKIDEIPLVLWSLSRRYKESYSRDETAHDLFDLTSTKDKLSETEGAQKMATRLVSLADGYDELRRIIDDNRKRKRFTYKLLELEENPDFLDQRIVTYFDNRSALPIHEYARFILRKILEHTRPLVDESVLAARLGVDEQRSKDWENLLSHLEPSTRYEGPFREGWPRWWWSRVNDWWKGEVSDESLKRLSAESRVDHLSESLNLDGLIAAEPIEEGYSSRFWTVCEYYGGPLDPTDGLRAQARNLEPWMDRPYISKKAALKRKGEVDPLDDGRFQRLKRRS